jgi:hypothetical protein
MGISSDCVLTNILHRYIILITAYLSSFIFMSTTIEAAARTRLDQPDIPESEKAFCERVIVQSEGQRAIDEAKTFMQKVVAAREMAENGLKLLSTQATVAGKEFEYRNGNILAAAVDNATYIEQQVQPFVAPLFDIFPDMQVKLGSARSDNERGDFFDFTSNGLRYNRRGTFSEGEYPVNNQLLGKISKRKTGNELVLRMFATRTRVEIVANFKAAIGSSFRDRDN